MSELTVSYDDMTLIQLPFAVSVIAAPTGLTATPVVGGGTFAAGTYYWEVTATTALGETTVSNEASAVIALNGSATLNWTAPVGVVTGYKVYRGTAPGAENVLVTTIVGNTTTFTDTNVGGAGTPPTTDTASIQDVTLLTGAGEYCGYSLAETTGSSSAWIEIKDTANTMAECRLSAGGSETEGVYKPGVPLYGKIMVHVNSGNVRGMVFARIPPIIC
jgi:hypothetical protein